MKSWVDLASQGCRTGIQEELSWDNNEVLETGSILSLAERSYLGGEMAVHSRLLILQHLPKMARKSKSF